MNILFKTKEITESRAKTNKQTYNGEFDPGSGLTLAAGLIHASRTVTGVAIHADEWRTGA